MARIELLVEEPSMKAFLSILLPKIIPTPWELNENYFIRSFEGKNDLQKNIPSKIKVFSYYPEKTGVVIIQDQDSNDCKLLKQELLRLCEQNGNCPTLIRIACRELEAWYIGNMKAIEDAYPAFKAQKHMNKAKFRNPDNCNASQEMKQLLPNDFQKIGTAKKIAFMMGLENNRSESFNQTMKGILNFFNKMKN